MNTWKAIFAFAGLALLIMLFEGCGKMPQTVEVQPGQYQIPAVPARDSTEIAGKDEGARLATIVVPPSDKPTTVRVYKRATALLAGAFSNTPRIDAVSDNQAVTVETPKKPLAWRWALLAGIVAGALWYLARKFFSVNLWSSAWRLLTRSFRADKGK